MIKTLHVQNYRNLRDLTVDFKQFNLITGKNNVGKSGLLEAVAIAVEKSADVCEMIATFRGAKTPLQILDAWRFMFSVQQEIKVIKISHTNEEANFVTSLYLIKNNEQSRIIDNFNKKNIDKFTTNDPLNANGVLVFTDIVQHKVVLKSLCKVISDNNRNKLISEHDTSSHSFSDVLGYAIELARDSEFAAKEYSKLEIKGDTEDVVKAFASIDDRIKRIVVTFQANTPTLSVDIGSGYLIPLSSIGDGMNWFAEIIMTIASSSNSYVIIDEIENGIHYSALKDMWKSIYHIAKKFNCQIFATTHSRECAKAAYEIFTEQAPNEFAYKRLARKTEDGTIVAIDLDMELLKTSFEQNWETR